MQITYYMTHQLVHIKNFGYCLLINLEGKDLKSEPQFFLLSGVN